MPPADDFIPLSRPCVLQAPTTAPSGRPLSVGTRTTFAGATGLGGGGADGGGDGGDGGHGGGSGIYDDDAAVAAAAARLSLGGPFAPPLKSQHHLPTEGNWLRLAGNRQYTVTRAAETARRRAAEAKQFISFGNEARVSASQRWAHQTSAGHVHGPVGPGAALATNEAALNSAAAKPGSFLPLKAGASALHVRAAPSSAAAAEQRRRLIRQQFAAAGMGRMDGREAAENATPPVPPNSGAM